MPDPDEEDQLLSLFNFEVHLSPSGQGGDDSLSATASFSEVSGLEINVEVREVREGGFNSGVRRLVGKTSHPNLVLKRGVTHDTAFWEWIQGCTGGTFPLPYASGYVLQFPAAQQRDTSKAARWSFTNAIVTKVKSADLNAAGGTTVPIEELHLAHEGLERVLT